MIDELTELLDTAIYKEISSQAVYIAAQKTTDDPGAVTLMKEMAAQELRHSKAIQKLKDGRAASIRWNRDRVPDLMLSDYLTGPDSPEATGLQDLLIFAMKREQDSVEFYSKMMAVMRDEPAKRLCGDLARWELRHKLKLELFYEGLYLSQD